MIILESFISMFWDIAPIIGMILIFQLFIIKEKIPNLTQTLFGIFMVWIGLALFDYYFAGFRTWDTAFKNIDFINFKPSHWHL